MSEKGDCVMVCEYCGRQFAQLPENGICPGCGAVVEDTRLKTALTTIPCGKYKGLRSKVILYETSLIVENKAILKKYVTKMFYDQITSVVLFSAQNPNVFEPEFLLFRWTGNQNAAIPERKVCYLDRTSVTISGMKKDFFYHLFYAMKYLAPSADIRIEGMNVALDQQLSALGNFDFDGFYKKYALKRLVARRELRRRFGFSDSEATAVVNRLFCQEEEKRYKADSKEALRDLNRILRKQ